MAYKCRICGSNEVNYPGDICELCAIGQDPYAAGMSGINHDSSDYTSDNTSVANTSYSPKRGTNRKVLLNGGASVQNVDPYGNDISELKPEPSVQVYSAGQTPTNTILSGNVVTQTTKKVSAGQPITSGIAKNITVDNQKKSILAKWFRALFAGVPFTLDDDVTMFQVFPDFTGTSLNVLGNACDQVIVYGRLNNGAVSENNDVEVYGRRDSNNNVIAKTIKNTASGTTISPQRSIGVGVVWVVTLIVLALIVVAVMGLGVEGIIWAAILVLCLTNLPKVIKIVGVLLGAVIKIVGVLLGTVFSLIKRLF